MSETENLRLEVKELNEQIARYDKVINEMRVETDAANVLWDTHLAQWEAHRADDWFTTYRKAMILAGYLVLMACVVIVYISGGGK